MLPTLYSVIPKVAESMKHGGGVPYSDYGSGVVCGIERMNGPSFRNLLTRKWLPAVDGLVSQLQSGITVADIGCGSGSSTIAMARTYPNSKFYGYDVDKTSIDRARELIKTEKLPNLFFEQRDAEQLSPELKFDFILTFDVVHDLAKPKEVLKAIYKALAPRGVYLMAEPRGGNSLEENIENPMAPMMYSISTLYCMTTCLAQGGPGHGTLMGPKIAEELCKEAGFNSFQVSKIQNATNIFYEVRKFSSNL